MEKRKPSYNIGKPNYKILIIFPNYNYIYIYICIYIYIYIYIYTIATFKNMLKMAVLKERLSKRNMEKVG